MKTFDLVDAVFAVGVVLLVIATVILMPIAYLACLNWLSDAAHWGWQIPLTWKTWIAAFVLFGASTIRFGK